MKVKKKSDSNKEHSPGFTVHSIRFVDGKVTLVPVKETNSESKRRIVTPETIQGIHDSKRRPELEWEKRRIRVRQVSPEGWESTCYLDLRDEASSSTQIALWASFEYADLNGSGNYMTLIADEIYQAAHRIWEFHTSRRIPDLYPEHPEGEDIDIPSTLEEIAQFLKDHDARIDWNEVKLIYKNEAE